MLRAGKAYELFENMAGMFNPNTTTMEKIKKVVSLNPNRVYSKETVSDVLFNPEVTPSERQEIVKDNLRTIIADPINVGSSLLGKLMGGSIVRTAKPSKFILDEFRKQVGKKLLKKQQKKFLKKLQKKRLK